MVLPGALFLARPDPRRSSLVFKGTDRDPQAGGRRAPSGGWYCAAYTVLQIAALDVVFSLDSVITAVGMVSQLPMMITAVVIAMGVMLIASGPTTAFVERHPTVKSVSFLLLIGMMLMADGFRISSNL